MSAVIRAADAVTSRPSKLVLRWLGQQSYEPVWRAMQAFTAKRGPDQDDELWLVEHDPVFTLGQAGREEHLLMPGQIPVIQVDRGGQVTYHGPGQVVAYPMLDLRRLKLGIKALVHLLEEAVIQTLAGYAIDASRRAGAPGVYCAQGKIAALGLRVRHGCCFHGLAFNVNMDLEPFSRINPCGFKDLQVTQVADLGGPGDWNKVATDVVQKIAELLRLNTETASPQLRDIAL